MRLFLTLENSLLPEYSAPDTRSLVGGFMRKCCDLDETEGLRMTREELHEEYLRYLNFVGGRDPYTGLLLYRKQRKSGLYSFTHLEVDHIHSSRGHGLLAPGNIQLLTHEVNAAKGDRHWSTVWGPRSRRHPLFKNLEEYTEAFHEFRAPYWQAHPVRYSFDVPEYMAGETLGRFREAWDTINPKTPLPEEFDSWWETTRVRPRHDLYENLFQASPVNNYGMKLAQYKRTCRGINRIEANLEQEEFERFLSGELSLKRTREIILSSVKRLYKPGKPHHKAQEVVTIGNLVLSRFFDAEKPKFTWEPKLSVEWENLGESL